MEESCYDCCYFILWKCFLRNISNCIHHFYQRDRPNAFYLVGWHRSSSASTSFVFNTIVKEEFTHRARLFFATAHFSLYIHSRCFYHVGISSTVVFEEWKNGIVCALAYACGWARRKSFTIYWTPSQNSRRQSFVRFFGFAVFFNKTVESVKLFQSFYCQNSLLMSFTQTIQ